MFRRKAVISLVIFCAIVLLAGCLKKESLEEMDVPGNEDAIKASENVDEQEIPNNSGMVARDLYFIDSHGMVASQTIELPLEESMKVATQVLEHLIVDGPGSSVIPNGFRGVLPEGTEILGINIQEDGTVIVDVSEEFKEYAPEDEIRILEAMTYSLTQFDSIDTIRLQINGDEQNVMPVNKTPIGKGYTRSRGINVVQTDTTDFLQSEAVTVFYPTEYNENRYYVPVTQYISQEASNKYESLVHALIEGPKYHPLQITQVFNPQTTLTSEPTLTNGILEIEFNDRILKEADEGVISDEVMETLVRTLTDDDAVKAVRLKVKNVETIQSESGKIYDEPVTKEQLSPKEKL